MKLVEPEEPKDTQVNGIITQEQSPEEEEDDDDEWKVSSLTWNLIIKNLIGPTY